MHFNLIFRWLIPIHAIYHEYFHVLVYIDIDTYTVFVMRPLLILNARTCIKRKSVHNFTQTFRLTPKSGRNVVVLSEAMNKTELVWIIYRRQLYNNHYAKRGLRAGLDDDELNTTRFIMRSHILVHKMQVV